MNEVYDADYFLRGKETGKSLYTNYRWMPDLTIPMCQAIVDHCGIAKGAHILDFGCARGYTVKALRALGYDAYGVDASEWAIDNCDPDVQDFVEHGVGVAPTDSYEWVIAKDVLEHVDDLEFISDCMMEIATAGIFVVVPLSRKEGSKYVVPDYEEDITHRHRFPLSMWASLFVAPGWSVEARYHLPGVKDNYYKPGWEKGNGFITVRRV